MGYHKLGMYHRIVGLNLLFLIGNLSMLVSALRMIGRSDQWLSHKNPTLKEIKNARREALGRQDFGDRIRLFMYRFHSIGRTTSLFVGVLISLIFLAWIIGWFFETRSIRALPLTPGIVLAVAGILGGIVGILIAIIVFAVQFHGEPTRDASPLMGFLIKWEALVPITGITLSFVSAQVVAALLSTLWWESVTYGMAIIDILFFPVVIWLVMYLFHRMLYIITTDFFTQSILPGLIFEYSSQLDSESRWKSMDMAFYGNIRDDTNIDTELGKIGIKIHPWLRIGRDNVVPLGPSFSGTLVDANLSCMKNIADIVRVEYPKCNLVFTRGMGDSLEETNLFYLQRESDECADWASEKHQIFQKKIDKLCRKSVKISRGELENLDATINAIVASTIDRIQRQAFREAEQALGVIYSLHVTRMKRPDRERIRADDIDFIGFFGRRESVYSIARVAGQSGDSTAIGLVIDFALRVAASAVKYDLLPLYQQAIRLLSVLYFRIAESDTLGDDASRRIDSSLDSISHIDIHLTSDGSRSSDSSRKYLRVAIGEIIRISKNAIRFGHIKHGMNFAHRASQIVQHHSYRNPTRGYDEELMTELLHGQILLVGWAIALAKKGIVDASSVIEVRNGIINHNNDLNLQPHWMETWDKIHADGYTSYFDDESWLEGLENHRSGVSYSRLGSHSWSFYGLVFLLLASGPSRFRSRESTLSQMPKDHASVETAISEVLSTGDMQVLLTTNGNDSPQPALERKLEDSKATVMACFESRRIAYKKHELEVAVQTPVSPVIICSTLRDAQAALEQNVPGWLQSMSDLPSAKSMTPYSIQHHARIAKHFYIGENSSSGAFGEHYGKLLSCRECIDLVYYLEQQAKSSVEVCTLEELKESIRLASRVLKDGGFNPDVLLLPKQARFANSLTGLPSYRRNTRQNEKIGYQGTYEGLDMYHIPYSNTASVIVADSRKLWGRHDLQGSHLTLSVEDEFAKQNSSLVLAALSEKSEEKIPTVDAIKILTKWRLIPRFGVADVSAARIVSLDLSVFGYAFTRNGKCYHRPDCKHISNCNGVEFGLSLSLDGKEQERKPCSVCDPRAWDWEGEYE